MNSADGHTGGRFAKKGLDECQQLSLAMALGQTGGRRGAPDREGGVWGGIKICIEIVDPRPSGCWVRVRKAAASLIRSTSSAFLWKRESGWR
jgi:hypothetical protein